MKNVWRSISYKASLLAAFVCGCNNTTPENPLAQNNSPFLTQPPSSSSSVSFLQSGSDCIPSGGGATIFWALRLGDLGDTFDGCTISLHTADFDGDRVIFDVQEAIETTPNVTVTLTLSPFSNFAGEFLGTRFTYSIACTGTNGTYSGNINATGSCGFSNGNLPLPSLTGCSCNSH